MLPYPTTHLLTHTPFPYTPLPDAIHRLAQDRLSMVSARVLGLGGRQSYRHEQFRDQWYHPSDTPYVTP